jgi:hypothetical protein
MAGPGGIDLTARTWNDIAGGFVGAEPKGTLLIGNGLSRAVWDHFSYESLLDRATDEGLPHHLTGAQKQIFDTLGTPNFEPCFRHSTTRSWLRIRSALTQRHSLRTTRPSEAHW